MFFICLIIFFTILNIVLKTLGILTKLTFKFLMALVGCMIFYILIPINLVFFILVGICSLIFGIFKFK